MAMADADFKPAFQQLFLVRFDLVARQKQQASAAQVK